MLLLLLLLHFWFCLPACLPGYPHKITILSDCILRLCRAWPCLALPGRVYPLDLAVASRLRLISICCRAKFMTVISKRRAANTFLMPHAACRMPRTEAASCRKPHEYTKVSNRNCGYRTPFCCLLLLAARLHNLPHAVAMFTRPRQISL